MTYPANKIGKLVAVLGFLVLIVLFFILIDTLENAPSRRNRVSIQADLKFFCPSEIHEPVHLELSGGKVGAAGSRFTCPSCGRRFMSTALNLVSVEVEVLELEARKRKDSP